MTESKPSYNTLELFLEEGMLDYESDTTASRIYGHPPATPPTRGSARLAPNPFVEHEDLPSPLARRTAVDPALGVLHNKLD
uniref:Uncharacterized protein n=1 Tax=Peronospora matthiolae TaxID=2874970 RepID=A0AAV1T634_9STRA